MDKFKNFGTYLMYDVFKCLSIYDLVNVSSVSKYWYKISSSDVVWDQHYKKLFFIEGMEHAKGPKKILVIKYYINLHIKIRPIKAIMNRIEKIQKELITLRENNAPTQQIVDKTDLLQKRIKEMHNRDKNISIKNYWSKKKRKLLKFAHI